MIRTRFAPSPTGRPHVGNIRTAIFDFLEAKVHGGEFILRIEDTDQERFIPDAVEYIKESLRWLGLTWDNEKILHQSQEIKVYQKYADELLQSGKAYKCYCSKERLEKLKEKQRKTKIPPGYDGHCRNLTEKDLVNFEQNNCPYVIRFRIPDEPKEVCWKDEIRDKVCIRTDIQEDFVILKSDGFPTYNFANVIDDHLQKITLVIRGEEFIPSTPKHLLLYDALGWQPPEFAHMPLIVGKDRAKLSKRHGDTSILEYREKGYLPEAMVNFLALLGWNDGTTQELFTIDELKEKFSIERVGKAPAVFDIDRLNWINGEKIRALEPGVLFEKITEFDPGFVKGKSKDLLKRAVQVMQTRMVTLADFSESGFFYKLSEYKKDLLIFKKSTPEKTLTGLKKTVESLEEIVEVKTAEEADKTLLTVVSKNNLANGDVFWPVRVALSGQEKSPSPGELLWALGKEEALVRITGAIRKINS